MFRLSVNGRPCPNTWNQFKRGGPQTFDFGNVALVAGANTFRFEVVDVNPQQKEKPRLSLIGLTFSRRQEIAIQCVTQIGSTVIEQTDSASAIRGTLLPREGGALCVRLHSTIIT